MLPNNQSGTCILRKAICPPENDATGVYPATKRLSDTTGVAAKTSLLLVGDVGQIPSVGPGIQLRNIIHGFAVPEVRLTQVFGQAAHRRILTPPHRINDPLVPELPATQEESDFNFIDRTVPEALGATLVEMVRTRMPAKLQRSPTRAIQVLCPMKRGSLGIRDLNIKLQGELILARSQEPVVEKFG
jgi:exodeoxyribonuclease V alpha subunit